MSQVSYGIPRICCVGFPQNSAWQLADFREFSAKLSQTIRRNIAGYPQNLCTYLRNDPLKGCRRMFKGDCTAIYARFTIPEDNFADSRRRFCKFDNFWSPKDHLEDSHKSNPQMPKRQFRGFPKDNSADPEDDSTGSPQTIRKFPHRLSWKSATDYSGSLQISISNLWHVPYNWS